MGPRFLCCVLFSMVSIFAGCGSVGSSSTTASASTPGATPTDNWLKNNIDPLIKSPALANSVFIIVFDGSLDVDLVNGGGHIAMVVAGSHVKAGFKSTTFYQHQSTLRLVLDLLLVADHPGNSATAPTMQEFFQ